MPLDLLQAPIPGQSLTGTPKAAPYEMPPQHADIEPALEEIWNKLTMPKQLVRLVLILKKGVPVEYLAKTILFEGFAQGKWTPDMAFLMLKITMSMILAIAHLKNIKVKIFNPDMEQDKFLDQFKDMSFEDTKVSEEPIAQPENKPALKGLLGIGL